MIKAILFDATGTLIYLPKGIGFHYADVAGRHGMELEPASLDRAFRKAWTELAAPETIAGPRADDDQGWWRSLVLRVLREVGGTAPDFDAFFEELYGRFAQPGVWKLFPEVIEVLHALKGRFQLAVVSNFDGRLRKVLEQLEITDRFEQLVISSEIGADKPDPLIFQAACQRLGTAPGETLHVGDEPDQDWAGARAAGLHVFELDRSKTDLRDLVKLLGRAAQV